MGTAVTSACPPTRWSGSGQTRVQACLDKRGFLELTEGWWSERGVSHHVGPFRPEEDPV